MKTDLKEPSQHVLLLLDCQRRVLERIASGAPLAEVMLTLVTLVEHMVPQMRCAILQTDAAGERLRFVAAPSLPEDFKRCVEPFLRVGADMSNCGKAAFLRQPVYTEDTAIDPRWAPCRDVAMRNGLRAIWSTPILGDDNAVLGTFAMFYREPRLPSREHIQLIDMAVQMARVAIEAERRKDALGKSEETLRVVIDTIPTMVWSVLPDGAVDFVNKRWLDYTGSSLAKALAEPTVAVHSEDLRSVMERWSADMAAGEPFESEMRLRRADGQYRWFLVRTVPLRDEHGHIVKWYGTSTDIHDRKQAEETLRRNQAFFADEAQHIGSLLGTSAPALRPPPLDEVNRIAPGARLGVERQAMQSLTSTERAILRLITEGHSNAKVGELLRLSPRTVETYRARLMQKLQVEDLVALVKFAIRHGMSSVD